MSCSFREARRVIFLSWPCSRIVFLLRSNLRVSIILLPQPLGSRVAWRPLSGCVDDARAFGHQGSARHTGSESLGRRVQGFGCVAPLRVMQGARHAIFSCCAGRISSPRRVSNYASRIVSFVTLQIRAESQCCVFLPI